MSNYIKFFIGVLLIECLEHCDLFCIRNVNETWTINESPQENFTCATCVHLKPEFPSSWSGQNNLHKIHAHRSVRATTEKCEITLALVLCKDETVFEDKGKAIFHDFSRQMTQTIGLLKSIALTERFFSQNKRINCVNVIVVANQNQIVASLEKIVKEEWDEEFSTFLKLSYVPAIYPSGYEWMSQVYRPCATIRLFMDKILPDIDAIIYSDTDIIYLRSLSSLWAEFDNFSDEMVAGLIPEWNNTKHMKDLYNPTAYNTGVMLMNLTRMRAIDWTQRLGMVSTLFLADSVYGDQDMLVIYFTYFPAQLLDIPCHWNFAPRNCLFGRKCAEGGISAIHGLVGSFVKQGFEIYFENFFNVFRDAQLFGNFSSNAFISDMGNRLWRIRDNSNHNCSIEENFGELVMKSLQEWQDPPRIKSKILKISNLPLKTKAQLRIPSVSDTMCVPVAITFCEYPSHKNSQPLLLNQTLVLLKSLALMAYADDSSNAQRISSCVNAFIFSPHTKSFKILNRIVETWDAKFKNHLHLIFVQTTYSQDYHWLRDIFAPCATLRLFYADYVPNQELIIHLDSDMIFTRPVKHLWEQFKLFKEETLVATSPEIHDHLDVNNSQIFYRPNKFQGGVILMNLTRMREVGFTTKMKVIATLYKNQLEFPVQDSLGIYFHYFPNHVALLSCGWNFLAHYCHHLHRHHNHPDQTLCQPPEGISVLHGASKTFTNKSFEPAYRKIFEYYEGIDLSRKNSTFSFSTLIQDLDLALDGMAKEFTEKDSTCASAFTFKGFVLTWMKNGCSITF